MTSEPKSIKGDTAVDDRGSLRFVNDFSFSGVKRFYQVENFSDQTIRAFHGHLKEGKFVYVVKGSILLCYVPLTKVIRPSKKAKLSRVVLSARKPEVVYIPPGFANGFRTLEKDTVVMFFSTSSLEESKGDDYRYPADYWGADIWQIQNR